MEIEIHMEEMVIELDLIMILKIEIEETTETLITEILMIEVMEETLMIEEMVETEIQMIEKMEEIEEMTEEGAMATVTIEMAEREEMTETTMDRMNQAIKLWETTHTTKIRTKSKLSSSQSTEKQSIQMSINKLILNLMEMKEEESEEVMEKEMMSTMIPRKTDQESIPMNLLDKVIEILERIKEMKETENLKGKEKEKEERETEEIMKDQEAATSTMWETITRTTMTMVFILTNAQIVTDSGAELVEQQFLLNTDHSGMKTKVPRWFSSTRRE